MQLKDLIMPQRCKGIGCSHNVPSGEDFCGECTDLVRTGDTMPVAEQFKLAAATPPNPPASIISNATTFILQAEGYDRLGNVLFNAFVQASGGKGAERHSDGQPFNEQPIVTINKTLGSYDGQIFQAMKKAHESKRLPKERAIAELLGAINYLAAAVIQIEDTK